MTDMLKSENASLKKEIELLRNELEKFKYNVAKEKVEKELDLKRKLGKTYYDSDGIREDLDNGRYITFLSRYQFIDKAQELIKELGYDTLFIIIKDIYQEVMLDEYDDNDELNKLRDMEVEVKSNEKN